MRTLDIVQSRIKLYVRAYRLVYEVVYIPVSNLVRGKQQHGTGLFILLILYIFWDVGIV